MTITMRSTAPQGLRERVRVREGMLDVLLFRAGSELFALDLVEVEEALDLPDTLGTLPEMVRGMLGVLPLRGALVPTFGPDVLLGVTSEALRTALVMRGGGRRFALAVDDVEDVATVALDELRAPPSAEGDGLLLGVFRYGERLVGLLDAEVIVAACRADGAREAA